MTPALAAEIADEQVRYWRYINPIRPSEVWASMNMPPMAYARWSMVWRAIYDHEMRATVPARLAA